MANLTRRQTLVLVLQGGNGYTPAQLKDTFDVPGVQEFLADAAARGISSASLADRLVAFKKGGGSGLANAIASISAEFNSTVATGNCEDTLAAIKAQVNALAAQVNAL